MDTDVSHAVKSELDKLHARIDKLIGDNNLQVKEEETPVEETTEGE